MIYVMTVTTQCAAQLVSVDTIGWGWSKTSINTVVFRKNSLVSDGQIQYAPFHDSSANEVLAKRDPDGKWMMRVHKAGIKGK